MPRLLRAAGENRDKPGAADPARIFRILASEKDLKSSDPLDHGKRIIRESGRTPGR